MRKGPPVAPQGPWEPGCPITRAHAERLLSGEGEEAPEERNPIWGDMKGLLIMDHSDHYPNAQMMMHDALNASCDLISTLGGVQ